MLSGGRRQRASKHGVDSPVAPSRWKCTAQAGGAIMVRSACAIRLVMGRSFGVGERDGVGEDASCYMLIYTRTRESNTLVTLPAVAAAAPVSERSALA